MLKQKAQFTGSKMSADFVTKNLIELALEEEQMKFSQIKVVPRALKKCQVVQIWEQRKVAIQLWPFPFLKIFIQRVLPLFQPLLLLAGVATNFRVSQAVVKTQVTKSVALKLKFLIYSGWAMVAFEHLTRFLIPLFWPNLPFFGRSLASLNRPLKIPHGSLFANEGLLRMPHAHLTLFGQ